MIRLICGRNQRDQINSSELPVCTVCIHLVIHHRLIIQTFLSCIFVTGLTSMHALIFPTFLPSFHLPCFILLNPSFHFSILPSLLLWTPVTFFIAFLHSYSLTSLLCFKLSHISSSLSSHPSTWPLNSSSFLPCFFLPHSHSSFTRLIYDVVCTPNKSLGERMTTSVKHYI